MDALHIPGQKELLQNSLSKFSSLDVSNEEKNIMILTNSSKVKGEHPNREVQHFPLTIKSKPIAKVYFEPYNTNSTRNN